MHERKTKIYLLRKEYKVPTYVIAREVGIKLDTVYQHEIGRGISKLKTAFAYARFWSKRLKCKVTVDELFGDVCGGE